MKFTGFNDWIEIFKGGKQVDSAGVEHDGDVLIEKAVSTFNAAGHEPPLVVGHPKDNAPAFGWVAGLKSATRNGTATLLARFKDVVPELESMVKKGLFKKRSAAFYPDGRLRHVGFLGAAPPAVKGLADLKFEDAIDPATFEFCNPAISTLKKPQPKEDNMKFAEFLEAFKFWKKMDPDAALPDFTAPPSGNFTEADIEAAKKEAAEAARKKAEDEFSEKERKGRREALRKENKSFCEQMVSGKKFPPAVAESGLCAFMDSLEGEEAIEFSEGEAKKTPLAWFKEFLEGLGELKIFDELAVKAKAGADFKEAEVDKAAGERIAAKANGQNRT